MRFNKLLLTLLSYVLSGLLLLSCANHPDKKNSAGKKSAANNEHAVGSAGKYSIPASILPAGPVTQNPYLLSKPTVSAQAEKSFSEAVVAMQQKNWVKAEALLQNLASESPNLSGVFLNLGIVYRAKGDSAKAADFFNKAISVNPKNVDAYNQLAVIKREMGAFTDAESLYLKALTVWPFCPDSHKNIAILYELYMGKSDQALPHYFAYQQLLPAPDKQVDSWIADLQRRLNGGKKVSSEAEKNDQAAETK